MRSIVSILIFLLLSFSASAQTPAPTSQGDVTSSSSATPTSQESREVSPPISEQAPSDELTEELSEESIPAEFLSAQASLQSFMNAMATAGPLYPGQYLIANRHLDLSGIPRIVRDERGATISQQLYSVLQASEIDPDEVDPDPSQDRVTLYRQPSGDRVELMRQPSGHWLFSARTVEAIPRMYAVLSGKGQIQKWQLELLNFQFLGLNGNLWLGLLLLPLFAYGFGSLAVMFIRVPMRPVLKSKVGLLEEEQKRLLKPVGWIIASLVAWLGLTMLDIPSSLLVAFTVFVKTTACVSVVVAAFRLSDVLSLYVGRFTAQSVSKFDDMLIPLVRRSVKTLVAVIGLLFLAQNLDVEVWSLFAGFSIFGAMVALAGQDTVKNFFGSITVLLDQPFGVGDWILVSDIEGVVEEVGFRSTRIRTFQDSLVTLPNSQLITASVDNFGVRSYRRYSKKLPIRWNTSPAKLETFCEGIREIVRRHPYTRKDSYQVWVNDINEYALEILVYIFFAVPDWNTELRERHRFLVDLHRLASELEVEFAYPSQRLLLSRKESGFEENFDLDSQENARREGKAQMTRLLQKSLPKEIPPPAVAD